ncbi:MAG: DUF5522 domain-containing protein [Bdellovibrionota bacterium]|nr:DUF5522 domain-containing protein [Bdellovibrionota bacterium]MEC8625016.1 DUF5522 domain-containing protein [Bdellovibrionota bacterium]
MNSLSYVNKSGDHVFTSHYHRKRGSCCKSKCLHCPFGTTIKAYGLTFSEVTSKNEKIAQEILDHHKSKVEPVAESSAEAFTMDLFGKAFGNSSKLKKEKETYFLKKEDFNQFELIFLKGTVCGLLKKKVIGKVKGIKECFLLPEFSDQGLSKDLIESFYSAY